MTETEARQVLLLQAVETGAQTPLWTADDRAWASRLAQQTAGGDAPPERFVAQRAGHAMQRLLPRDAAARDWLQRRLWRPAWLPAAGAAAFGLGALVDHIGSAQRVDLLAWPVGVVIVWNVAVYLGLLLPRRGGGLRRWLTRQLAGGERGPAVLWARHAAPLSLARAAWLLHGAAAMLALGLVAGLYTRGLVLDYRAGWQSTFLAAPLVQALLNALLAPASAVTGIAVPDVAPLRLAPGVAAAGPAAPWLHLFAATLALAVVLPRLALAAWAGWRAQRLSAHFPLALDDPYFQRLRLQQQGGQALVQVLPYAADCSAQAALGLRAVLAGVLGEGLQLQLAPTTPFGEAASGSAGTAVTGLRVLLFDLGATPEAEAQGRFIAALQGHGPLLLVADEAAFRRRFAGLPERLAQRRAAWQQFADAQALPLLCCDLGGADTAAATATLQRVLAR